MDTLRLRHLVVTALLLVMLTPVYAQNAPPTDSPARQRVGIIENSDLGTASPNDPGPDGTSRFVNIISSLGFEPVTLDLERPIPDDITVLILIRPQNQLSLRHSAILYRHLSEGNALMIATDPNRYFGVDAEQEGDMLPLIFGNDYGVQLRDTFLIQPWFSADSLDVQDLDVAQMLTHPEDSPVHPVVAPLTRYDLPVMTWAGRSVSVEPFGLDSFGNSLLYTESAYAETRLDFFGDDPRDPLEYNVGEDPIGRLPLAGIGVNTENGSRIMLFGDSELFQNGYGLSFNSFTELPNYPGNFLIAERAAAWMLGLPVVTWPAVPEGFTWVGVDGVPDDWRVFEGVPVNDIPLDQPESRYDLQSARGVTNTHYLYLLARTFDSPGTNTVLSLDVTTPSGDSVMITGENGMLYLLAEDGSRTLIPDGAYAVGDAIEARVPLRVISQTPSIDALCVGAPDIDPDCLDARLSPLTTETSEPAPLRIFDTPLATVRTPDRVNLRAAPSNASDIIDTVPDDTPLSLVGRTAGGDWLFVETGGYRAWINRTLVVVNTEVDTLPVVEQ